MNKIGVTILFLVLHIKISAQEGIPVYSDYLSDNVFLLHPSMAGIGNYSKLRLTHRRQWLGVQNAPALQTLSFHTRPWERTALGFILFKDDNGHHSEKGVQLAYAHHLNLSGNRKILNQLSFGINATMIHNELDESKLDPMSFDPQISGGMYRKRYFNADVGFSYHYKEFYAHFTVKNLIFTARRVYSVYFEPINLRNYITSAGYYFGNKKNLQWEPSFMIQLTEYTGEKIIDINLKAYKRLQKNRLWGGLSYRRGFDGNRIQEVQNVTGILGFNYKRIMISYTYTLEMGRIKLHNGGFHQIALGINIFKRKKTSKCGCPQINN